MHIAESVKLRKSVQMKVLTKPRITTNDGTQTPMYRRPSRPEAQTAQDAATA